MGCKAHDGSFGEDVRRKDIIPSPTNHTFCPDLERMEEPEHLNQEFVWQVVKWVTCFGYHTLYKVSFSTIEGADEAGEAAQTSVVFSTPGKLRVDITLHLARPVGGRGRSAAGREPSSWRSTACRLSAV
jgi:hypothetical protein